MIQHHEFSHSQWQVATSGLPEYPVADQPLFLGLIICIVIISNWLGYIKKLRDGMIIIKKTDHLYSWMVGTLRRFRWAFAGLLGLAVPVYITLEILGAIQ